MAVRNYVTIFTILFISVSAFGAGFLQDNVDAQVDELRSQMTELEKQRDRTEVRIQSIRASDRDYFGSAKESLFEGFGYDRELNLLQENLTLAEEIALMDRISAMMWRFRSDLIQVRICQIYWWFQIYTDDYIIASVEEDGFDFNITKSYWDDYVEEYPDLVTNFTYTEAYGLDSTLWGGFFSAERIGSSYVVPPFVLFPNVWSERVYDNFYYELVFEVQSEIDSLEDEVTLLERKSGDYTYALSLITVSAILASAMSDRMSDQEFDGQMSEILSEVKEDPSLKTSGTDHLALAVLILAGLIAVFGIVLPFLGIL